MNEGFVAIIGDINVDYIIKVDHMADYDGDVEIDELEIFGGGYGANTAYALSQLGDNVSLFGYVGIDQNGKVALADLEGKVDLSGVIRCGKTGICFSIIDKTGIRRLMTYKKGVGCEKEFDLEGMNNARWIHLAGLSVEKALKIMYNLKISSWDPGMPFLSSLKDLDPFTKVEYVLLNEMEFEVFQNFDKWKNFKNIIVKMGDKGVRYFKDGKIVLEIPAFRVEILDSTGAGDVFDAAFIHSTLNGSSVLESIEFASAAGALSVTKMGARSVPKRYEIEKFLKEVKK